jgi:hypothetical protein
MNSDSVIEVAFNVAQKQCREVKRSIGRQLLLVKRVLGTHSGFNVKTGLRNLGEEFAAMDGYAGTTNVASSSG